jgi:hypothetical protein
LYQLLTAEKKFWCCVESGETPALFGVEPPRRKVEAVRVVDMSTSNAGRICRPVSPDREAARAHERSSSELKALVPEDAKEAIGHEDARPALQVGGH